VQRPTALALHLALCSCVPAERPPGEHDAPSRAASARPARAKLAGASGELERPSTLLVGEPAELPVLATPFKDEFERDDLGDDYYATGTAFRLERGRLCVKGARNHPLWLRHRLPTNARIQVEAEAMSPDGDIKLEAWGDVQAAATRIAYTDATSYLAILGGWTNRYHVLARMDEHGSDRQEVVIEPGSEEPRQRPVQVGHRYRLKLERNDGQSVRFWADDVEILSLSDAQPLLGVGHDHFAFNDWETPVCFDHLVVEPLPS